MPLPVRHLVLLRFRDDLDPAGTGEALARFAALPTAIAEIRGFEWGPDRSTEGLNQGYTHAVVLSFDDIEAKNRYLVHPEHQNFASYLMPLLDKILVMDFDGRPGGA